VKRVGNFSISLNDESTFAYFPCYRIILHPEKSTTFNYQICSKLKKIT